MCLIINLSLTVQITLKFSSYSKVRDLGQATSVHLHHYKQSHQVAVDHRYKHEYGDSSTDSQPDIDIDLDGPNTDTTNDQPELDVSEMKNKFELALQNSNASSPKLAPTPRKESSRGEKPVTQKKKAKIADNSISKKSPHSKHTGYVTIGFNPCIDFRILFKFAHLKTRLVD